MKKLSDREKFRRKYLKIYNSVENKLHDSNLIWWDSLTLSARYSFIFKWIDARKAKPDIKFKHFIKDVKGKYIPSTSNRRNALIEHLIK